MPLFRGERKRRTMKARGVRRLRRMTKVYQCVRCGKQYDALPGGSFVPGSVSMQPCDCGCDHFIERYIKD